MGAAKAIFNFAKIDDLYPQMLQIEKLSDEVRDICKNSLSAANGRPIQERVRDCLQRSYSAVMRAHHNGASGKRVCAAHAECMDAIILKLYENFTVRRLKLARSAADKFCIVALGGYGRSELCPKSDVDIMFLYDNTVGDEIKTLIVDEILYPLWNTGLKLGHSSRTRREAIADARSDVISKNSMLDARFICGSKRVYSAFERAFKAMCARNKQEHFGELMRLKRDRHAKFRWTPYLQEPNIKNGIGGLRDAQTMGWKTFLNFGSSDFRELAKRRIISLSEYKAVSKAYDFLLRVRNDMHYNFGRENDLLDLETQPKIAARLGFSDTLQAQGVEIFMRKIYYSFRVIDAVSKTARKRMGLELPGDVLATMRHMGARKPRNRKFTVDGFSIYCGEVDAVWYNVFKTKPSRLINVFLYCQEYGAVPSDKLEVMIKDSRHLIDASVRSNKRTNAAFLKILERTGNVFPTLEMMHFWGVLGRFIEEFGDITCMVQHEFYHRFTADVHTLNTIAQLDKIFCARQDGKEPFYWDYHKVLVSTKSPASVYLMLFFHDIGKGDGIRGHAEVGAEIASRLLDRLGVPPSDAEPIIFAIKNHLEMARFWQLHDVEDEKSIAKFASLVGNEEHLKYLYILTFCDAMGTSESFWNSYKQSLHSMLYSGTLAYLQKEESQRESSYRRRSERVMKELLAMPDMEMHSELLKEHFANLPRNYFLFHGRDDVAVHIKMIARLLRRKSTDMPILEWRDDPNRSISKLCVVSYDRGGLFAVLAGILSLAGLDILGSKILTRPDGITIDTFYVTGISGGLSENPRVRERFARQIASALNDPSSLDSEINDRFYSDSRTFSSEVNSDVFMRRESGKIILDIRTPDRVGLLYKIAKTIHLCGYNILFARINTENRWAQDTFHIDARPLAEPLSVLGSSLKSIL